MAGLKLPSNPKRRRARQEPELDLYLARRAKCPYGCLPGQCLNGRCPARMIGHRLLCPHPDLEAQAAARQKQRDEEAERQSKADMEVFLAEERRLMAMRNPKKDENEEDEDILRPSKAFLEFINRKQPTKSMRPPARPLCMLEAADYKPPSGDYSELSRFLRLSTMPGYSSNDHMTQYRSVHSQDVWDGQKDLQRQAFRMKRDWLSVWGEFNVKEQRWRKAWVEKFGADKV
ncbi:hypothetical protein EGW08_003759 [Elysia chlorotica]|uniref:Uncharacterized protein n=1 Tax=Elysia chlorotica TaxID=188477 RepID=A0A433U3V4_ELYCH|nr:hypothetical protein EGW08_003759 [Elysia chlorotica]